MKKDAHSYSDKDMEQILEKRVEELEKEVSELKKKLSHIDYKEIVVDDTITFEEAKKRVLDFLAAHPDKNYYCDELMEILHIDSLLIQQVLWKLEEEGKVV